MSKIIYSLLFIVCMSLPVEMMAQSFTYNYQGVDFKCKIKKGRVSIVGFDNEISAVKIPAQVEDKNGRKYQVEILDLYSEAYNYKTSTVVIDNGITEIGDLCFLLFKDLSAVYIPKSIERIGKKAFSPKIKASFNMPSNISETDLLAGKPVYPKSVASQPIDPLANVDMSDYGDDVPSLSGNETTEMEPEIKTITPGTSDIDFNIPSTNLNRENTFCVIIANEKYEQKDTPGVSYAAQDGQTFYNYCIRTLGLPKENIRMKTNAKYLEMKTLLEWFEQIGEVYGNDANFILYYAGHGIPDEKGNCKLVPVNVSINDVNNGFSLADMYSSLGKLTTKSALVLIDACFSGNDRSNVTALNDVQRGVVRKIVNEDVTGNVIVMTAASNTETAMSYDEKAHGLFSYYLMKKIQETKGNVTLGELYDFVKKEVMRKSTVVMGKKQTPSISVSKSMTDWKNIKF